MMKVAAFQQRSVELVSSMRGRTWMLKHPSTIRVASSLIHPIQKFDVTHGVQTDPKNEKTSPNAWQRSRYEQCKAAYTNVKGD